MAQWLLPLRSPRAVPGNGVSGYDLLKPRDTGYVSKAVVSFKQPNFVDGVGSAKMQGDHRLQLLTLVGDTGHQELSRVKQPII